MRAVRVRAAVLSLIAAAVLVAGCSGSGGNDPTAAPTIGVQAVMTTPTVAAPTTTIDTQTPPEQPAPPATAPPTPPATVTPTPTPTAIPTATATPDPPTPAPEPCPGAIPWDQAIGYAGQEVTVIGPVASATWASDTRGQPTFLNLGLPYPDPGRFTVLLWIDARWRFNAPPEETFAGQTVCVTGVVEIYQGGAEIEVEYPWQIVAP